MYPFKEVEQEVSKLWQKNNKEIKASLKYNPKKKLYSFLEGPPTANAPPGLHHVEVRVFKDLFCRFKHMRGYSVPRKGGWDCHGLPVEVQIEKALKLNSKKDILNYGIEKFNKQCKDSVFSYIKEWNKLTERMAFWIDLEHPYVTLNNEYIESVWWSLKELYNKKMLYEGHKVVPFCPRCETPLSSHEVALGYKEITEPAITIKFKVKDSKNRYFLSFTTTAWTVPSNVALVVNKNIDYAIIKSGNEEYILANDLVKKYFTDYKVIKKVKGKELLELKYEPIFPYFKDLKNSFRVIHGDFVFVEEGTGVVHAAAAFGEDDFEVCKLNKIDFVKPIDETGHFTSEVADFKGMFVKDADPKIINYLDNKKILFKKENYTHTYPFCWRCDTPLIYYAMLSWFIKVSEFRKELLKNNEKVNWFPRHIKEGRFGNWLEGAKDWALSRKKFWGTPLPIWRCHKCKNEIIIGSIKELKDLSGIKKEIDLHKPFIDEVKIKCNKCSNLMARVSDVIDCWYDSGSAIFAQFHYPFENKEMFNKSFPYNFIAEAIDQTRGWFYTLHVLAVLLFGRNAYDNVVCAGHIVDENGEKMSKSKGNIINPFETFDKVGVDAVRLQFCVNDVGDQKRFSLNLINQQVMPFLTILWNSHQYSKNINLTNKPELQIEDEWLLSRINTLINQVTLELEKHNYHKCLNDFIIFANEDLSRTYIKLIRERVDDNDTTVGYVFNYVFERLSKLLAPFAPYISDYLYSNLKNSSVHLSEWPLIDKKLVNNELEKNMNDAKLIIQEILAQRNKEKIGVRWPLKEITIKANNDILNSVEKLEDLIKKQVNCKKLKLVNAKENTEIILNTETNSELEKEGFTREVLRRIQDLRKKMKLNKKDKIELYISADTDLDFELIKKISNAKIAKYFESSFSEGFNVKEKDFEVRIKKI